MALKVLQPGYLPLGQFDLEDDDAGQILGGEYVELATVTDPFEGYAADVGAVGGLAFGGTVNFARGTRTAAAVGTPNGPKLGGLADEGGAEYGTLFGSLIGSNAGRATQFGVVGGAVVVGPTTDRASGKVTVWAQAGLYGIAGAAATYLTPAVAATTNDRLEARATGGADPGHLTTANTAGAQVAIYVAPVSDSSLVSTTATAVGAAAVTEYHAVFYLGNAASTVA
jgi:hypothetical protein